jgi:hypothetical protein
MAGQWSLRGLGIGLARSRGRRKIEGGFLLTTFCLFSVPFFTIFLFLSIFPLEWTSSDAALEGKKERYPSESSQCSIPSRRVWEMEVTVQQWSAE